MGSFFRGALFVLKGYQQLWQPTYRRYAIAPCLVALLLLAALVTTGVTLLMSGVQQLDFDWQFSNWASFLNPVTDALEWVLKSVIVVFTTLALLFFCIYCFTFLSATILSPWLSDLAASVADLYDNNSHSSHNISQSFWSAFLASLGRETSKLKRYLLLASLALAVSLLLGWIPGIAPLTWTLLTAWWLAFEYCDYHTDNQGGGFADTKQFMQTHRIRCLGFGCAALIATIVPVVNLFVVPACVCGATHLRIALDDLQPQP